MDAKSSNSVAETKLDQRVDLVCSHLTYEIATGVYQPDSKLPTVREATNRWNVDHRIVIKAYKRLAELGLVYSKPRSGYFVAAGMSHDLVSKYRYELESIFERMSNEIAKKTGLSTLGAFRYLVRLAEIKTSTHPECVFVECTHSQASSHAAEVTEELSIPCEPITIERIGGSLRRLPRSVKTVLVTAFHYGEINQLENDRDLTIHSVQIQVAKELRLGVTKGRKALVIEEDESQAKHMALDLENLSDLKNCRLEVTSDINETLHRLYGTRKQLKGTDAYLSPRIWGQIEPKWQKHKNVKLIRFQIVESAWLDIADAVGLPLGNIPCSTI